MSSSTSLVLVFLAIATVVLAVNEQNPLDSLESGEEKTDEIIGNNKRPSFFVGSRYGRSYYGNAKSARVNVAPRNDRFFLGSRYGKRANDYMLPAFSTLQGQQLQQQQIESQTMANKSKFFTMSCVFTGFKNFFRCNTVNDIENYIQHLANDGQ